jgi:hypothetical protein
MLKKTIVSVLISMSFLAYTPGALASCLGYYVEDMSACQAAYAAESSSVFGAVSAYGNFIRCWSAAEFNYSSCSLSMN